MAKMLIVAPLADIYSGVGNFGAPALGIWRLCFWLREHGQHADVWDSNTSDSLVLPTLDETKSDIQRAEALALAFVSSMEKDFDLPSYEWVGMSVLSDTLVAMLGVIELLKKKYPKIKLVGGNHECTTNMQDTLGRSRLDAIILADAEDSMLRLMQGEPPHTIKGVIWRNFQPKPSRETFEAWNRNIRWGEIPYHAYWDRTRRLYDWPRMTPEERLDKEYEVKTVRVHSILACELSCLFCSVKTTRRWASGDQAPSIINVSPDALRENLLAVKAQVPDVMTIYDSSDEAWLGSGDVEEGGKTSKYGRATQYLEVLESIKPIMDAGLPRGMRYLIQCRTNDLNEEIIRRAGAAGVRHLTIGVESPVEQVRKDMRKPQKESLIRDAIRWGVEYDVQMYCLFIMFYPTITLEQLHEAVTNWRIYMDLGAVVSVEPFCMSYLGTDLHDDPRFITEFVGYEIPFSGKPAKRLKWATLIWPSDRRVCAILQWFRSNVDSFIEAAKKKAGHSHSFKGFTGKITVDCLEHALALYAEGKIPPWEPGEGVKSAVYQDYGDQMSGSEIAAAASEMLRPNKTGTRFNSTHSLLDGKAGKPHDPVGAIKGFIKDPALPLESLPDSSTIIEKFIDRKAE